jgi:surface antigen
MTIRTGVLRAMFGFALIGSLAACAGDPTGEYGPGPKENTGTLLGAITGAAIGSQFGGGTSGHVAGALIGNRIGASLDEEDRRRAYAAEIQALEGGAAGAPVGWRSPNGRYGSVVPGPYYTDNGRRCRAFTETIYIDGRPQTARGVACRNPDGSWTPVG